MFESDAIRIQRFLKVTEFCRAQTLAELEAAVIDYVEFLWEDGARVISLRNLNRRFGMAAVALKTTLREFLRKLHKEKKLNLYIRGEQAIVCSPRIDAFLIEMFPDSHTAQGMTDRMRYMDEIISAGLKSKKK